MKLNARGNLLNWVLENAVQYIMESSAAPLLLTPPQIYCVSSCIGSGILISCTLQDIHAIWNRLYFQPFPDVRIGVWVLLCVESTPIHTRRNANWSREPAFPWRRRVFTAKLQILQWNSARTIYVRDFECSAANIYIAVQTPQMHQA